jgi:hypothetical protein
MFIAKLSRSYFLTEVNGKTGFTPIGKGGLSDTQMVPRQVKARGLGSMIMAQSGNSASALGNTPQYSRQKCMPLWNYKNRNIYILSDSPVAIKALDSYQIKSKLVWDCHQSLVQLAEHNRVQLTWEPGHEGIEGNEIANQVAKLGSECPFMGPEPACGISAGITKTAVRDWANRDHKNYWESSTGLKQAKGFLQGPSVRRAKELLKLNRNQL